MSSQNYGGSYSCSRSDNSDTHTQGSDQGVRDTTTVDSTLKIRSHALNPMQEQGPCHSQGRTHCRLSETEAIREPWSNGCIPPHVRTTMC